MWSRARLTLHPRPGVPHCFAAVPPHRLGAYYGGDYDLDEIVWLEQDVKHEQVLALQQLYSGDIIFVHHV